ncbi:MAG: hypothetical protein C5B59_19615 [Bacteroidetes bacterium]|nr:MAG: hypothetical protein C5B59_19615 [Bacteroidota bacterium]
MRSFKKKSNKFRFIFFSAVLVIKVFDAQAQKGDAGELAKKLVNPIASLVSVPFQNNLDVGIGTNNGWRNTLNFQPVIPVRLSEKLNLIARWVQPIIFQQDVMENKSYQGGLSDAVASAFFSPSRVVNGFTWGAGPVFLVPVATNDYLATKKFGIGPTVVALKQVNGWTVGALINQIWSVAGNTDSPPVNQMFLQPFVAFNWKSGAGLVVNSETTLNWAANNATGFINMLVTGITKIGNQMISLQIGPRIPIAWPQGGKPDFGIRSAIILVFPK